MTYTTIVAGVGDLTDNAHVIDRACEMARLNDAVLLLVAGFDPVAPRDRARLTDTAPDIRPVEAHLTEDEAYEVVEKARDVAVERGVDLAQGVVVEGEAVSALTLVAIETQADLVVVGSRGVDSLLGRLFGAVSIQVLRVPFIAGNWKMNMSRVETIAFARKCMLLQAHLPAISVLFLPVHKIL